LTPDTDREPVIGSANANEADPTKREQITNAFIILFIILLYPAGAVFLSHTDTLWPYKLVERLML